MKAEKKEKSNNVPKVEKNEKSNTVPRKPCWLKQCKIPPQNLATRLFHREIHLNYKSYPYQRRCLYQNITPNFTITNVYKPPCFLRKFSPDGKYLLAFSPDQMSLEIYRYMGPSAAAELLKDYDGNPEIYQINDPRSNILNEVFGKFFRLKHVVNVASNGEQLNRECSLFTDDGKYMIIGSATPSSITNQDDTYRNFESVTPNPRCALDDYTLHVVDIEMGISTDSRKFKHDKIFLAHNQGLYLYRQTLAVLSVQHQTIHIFQVNKDGTLINVRSIGELCYEDDRFIINSSLNQSSGPTSTFCGQIEQGNQIIYSLKHRLLAFLFRNAKAQSEKDGNPLALRKFYHSFDLFLRLRMWKMQLLDEVHLLIKYSSEEVVTLRASEPNWQPSFFVVYNTVTTEVIAVYENESMDLLDIFENLTDFFRNARLGCESPYICSPANDIWARLIHDRSKGTLINARGGGWTEATKRILGQLPISAQSFSASPYLDLGLFSYDDKWLSVMERPKNCADHPIRFYGRDSGSIKFCIHAERVRSTNSNPPNSNRKLVAFTFHPLDPFAISVQRANDDYVVSFHIRHKPS